MAFLLTFIALSIINVIFSTIRSITTIKGGKAVASFISGGYFAFYNIMLIYTVADFPMWEKCLITFVCNVIGVYVVKLAEEKMRKDKLWKVEFTVHADQETAVKHFLSGAKIPFNCLCDATGNYAIFNIYCATQKESSSIKELAQKFDAKYFVTETKNL